MEERIAAPQVARLIGIKTATLAKWRCQHKGPRGWIQVSATHVTYPKSEVEAFLAARAADTHT
jgi:predicted DNA-binding transcriptional regulator AlpA